MLFEPGAQELFADLICRTMAIEDALDMQLFIARTPISNAMAARLVEFGNAAARL